MESIYIGMDLGASRLRLLAARGDSGKIFKKKTLDSPFLHGGEKLLEDGTFGDLPLTQRPGIYLAREIQAFQEELGHPTILALGISAAGRITAEKNFMGANTPRCFAVTSASGEEAIDILSPIKEGFPSVPIEIENDAQATANVVALHYQKKAIDPQKTYYLTISTGIGGGYRGDFPNEIGHIRSEAGFPPFVPLCQCGLRGCLEAYASGTGIINRLKALEEFYTKNPHQFRDFEIYESLRLSQKLPLREWMDSWGGRKIDIGQIFEGASQTKKSAIDSLEGYLIWDSAYRIGRALVTLTLLFGLEIIAVGGGVVEKNPFFLSWISQAFLDFAGEKGQMIDRLPQIVAPPMGEETSDYGAIGLVREM